MVKKWFSFIGKEIKGLHEAAYLLALFALLSQILGLVRDKMLAYSFGAGHELDVYYAAFRIPDLIFVSIGSVVSASILLPYFINRFNSSNEEGKKFSDEIFTLFFGAIVVISIVVYILTPYIVPFVIPGFAHDTYLDELILSVRIMLLSPFLLGLSNLFSSLTQMRHKFLVYAVSPALYNIGIILGTVFLYPFVGVTGLAVGVACGAFLHMAVQIPFLMQEGIFPRFSFDIEWKRMRAVFYSAFPRMFTLSANQMASFVLISLASLMSFGSISIFTFAFNLQAVPLTIIGASYSSAVFPTLSRLYVEKNIKEFLEKMIASARHIIFWSMPIMVLFIVLRAQIVRTILGAGKFDWADTRITAAMLALFMVSTIGQSLVVLFVRAFYAEGKTSKPLIINAISAAIIIIGGFVFVRAFGTYPFIQYFFEELLKVSGQTGTVVLMLALAYSFGVIINLVLHWISFEKSYPGFTKPVLGTLYHSFSASIIMGYVAFQGLRLFSFFPTDKVWGIFMQGFSAGLIGLIAGILILILLKNRELHEVWRTLHRKIWKASVPPAEVERL